MIGRSRNYYNLLKKEIKIIMMNKDIRENYVLDKTEKR